MVLAAASQAQSLAQEPLLFRAFLSAHVLSGFTCVVVGPVTMLIRKRRGPHTLLGEVYFWSLAVVFVSASGLSIMHWPMDAYLLVLGTMSFGSGVLAYLARKTQWKGWLAPHIIGMGMSYVVLLTAFYVDNGPKLTGVDRLPHLAYWLVPSLIGIPLILRAMGRRGLLTSRRRPTPVTSAARRRRDW